MSFKTFDCIQTLLKVIFHMYNISEFIKNYEIC